MCLSHILERLHVDAPGCVNGYDVVNRVIGSQFIYSLTTFQNKILKNIK